MKQLKKSFCRSRDSEDNTSQLLRNRLVDALRMPPDAKFASICLRNRNRDHVPAQGLVHSARLCMFMQKHELALETILGVAMLLQVGLVDAHVLGCHRLIRIVATMRRRT